MITLIARFSFMPMKGNPRNQKEKDHTNHNPSLNKKITTS